MKLLFKMQTILVTFSLTLMLKVRVPDIQMWEGTWYDQASEKCVKIKRINIHMWTVWLLKCLRIYFSALKTQKKGKVQVPQQNEMLSIYSIILSFTSLKLFKTIFLFLYSYEGELIQTWTSFN